MKIYPTMIIQTLWQIRTIFWRTNSSTLEHMLMPWNCIKRIWLSCVVSWRSRYLYSMLWRDQIGGGGVSLLWEYQLTYSCSSPFNTSSQTNSMIKHLNHNVLIQCKFAQVKYVHNALNALQAALALAKLTQREKPIFVGVHCRCSCHPLHELWPFDFEGELINLVRANLTVTLMENTIGGRSVCTGRR